MCRPCLTFVLAFAALLSTLTAVAQETTEIPGELVIAPSEDCTVIAPTFAELATLIATPGTPVLATPAAPDPIANAVGPVDAETEAAIRETLHLWLACQSYPTPLPLKSLLTASYALQTDRAIRAELTAEGLADFENTLIIFELAGSPPLEPYRAGLIAVLELALQADGRVTGVVEWGIEVHSNGRVLYEDRRRERMLFEQNHGAWLIDERLRLARQTIDVARQTPTP